MHAQLDTSMGQIKIKLYDEKAPNTVGNFVGLAEGTKEFADPKTGQPNKGAYYDDLIFHRVIEGFMIQGGCPTKNGLGGPGYNIPDEIVPELLHSRPGIVAMANTGLPNSGGSQFYITLNPTPHLDGGYSVFGEVVEGMDVVSAIGTVSTDGDDIPLEKVILKKVTIIRD